MIKKLTYIQILSHVVPLFKYLKNVILRKLIKIQLIDLNEIDFLSITALI